MTGISIVCTLLSAATALQPSGAGGRSPQIAVVNLASVFERYQMTRDLEQRFAERRQGLTSEAEKRRDDIAVQRNALDQFKPDSKDFRDRQESLLRSEIEFQVWLEVQERKLKNEHKSWLRAIYADVQSVVAKLAKERSIDLVLTYSDIDEDVPDSAAFKQQIMLRTVLFATERIDLTGPTLEMLDAGYQEQGGAAALKRLSGRGNGGSDGAGP